MPKLVRLTDAQVRKIKEPGRHAVDSGANLYVNVPPVGVPTFVWRGTVKGKRVLKTISPVFNTPLAAARAEALRIAQALATEADAPVALPTFKDALDAYLARRASGWKEGGKSADQWRQSMTDYVLPKIGHVTIDGILPSHIVEVLAPIWSAKPETARRVRQRISAVLTAEFRMRQMMRADPADERLMKDLLPRLNVEVRHHPAPTPVQAKDALQWLTDTFASHRCLRFILLHACRSGEARGATWGEFADGVWTVPAVRMKAGKVWRSPVIWLPERPKDATDADLVFPGFKDKPLSDMAILQVLKKRRLGWTPHGCRAAFRSWAATAGIPTEVSERQLAHTPDKLTQAYQRDDLIEQRRAALEAWRCYILLQDSI